MPHHPEQKLRAIFHGIEYKMQNTESLLSTLIVTDHQCYRTIKSLKTTLLSYTIDTYNTGLYMHYGKLLEVIFTHHYTTSLSTYVTQIHPFLLIEFHTQIWPHGSSKGLHKWGYRWIFHVFPFYQTVHILVWTFQIFLIGTFQIYYTPWLHGTHLIYEWDGLECIGSKVVISGDRFFAVSICFYFKAVGTYSEFG